MPKLGAELAGGNIIQFPIQIQTLDLNSGLSPISAGDDSSTTNGNNNNAAASVSRSGGSGASESGPDSELCDEGKPRCGNCLDRNEKCVYVAPSHSRPQRPVTFQTSSRSSDSGGSSHPATPPEVYDDGEFDEIIPRPGPEYTTNRVIKVDLSPHFALVPGRPGRPTNEAKLLHHWITVTCSGVRFPNRSSTAELMREAIPQLATSYPFLQDALLACAAVHLIDRTAVEPQTLVGSASSKYFTKALRSFQQILSEPEKAAESAEAVFATSMLIALWNGMNAFHHSNKDEFYDDFVRFFRMSQGTKTVGFNYWSHLDGTRCRRLIEAREGATVLDEELPDFLKNERLMLISSRVKDGVDQEVDDPALREVYRITMSLIEWVHAALLIPTNTISELAGRVNTFPSMCPGAFVTLLAQRDERAIAIAAHYMATACKVDNYKKRVGRLAVDYYRRQLDECATTS
ncbi:hypothetical protein TWF192_000880 [Orbilia oligospora]|nr:hypothetical protein TWF192_000880 [Orbilia oligospora]